MIFRRIVLRGTIGLALFLGLALLLLLVLPVGLLRSEIEKTLSHRIGQPVKIVRISRAATLSFTPDILLEGVSVEQPGWAGRGHWMEIDRARFRLPLLPALIGRVHPTGLRVDGLRLKLLRAADGKKNWSNGASSGEPARLPDDFRLTGGHLLYGDAKQDRALTLRFQTDDKGALDLVGSGRIAGHPVTVTAHGGPTPQMGLAWPFSVQIAGPGVRFLAHGSMEHALDSRAMTIDVSTRADDLKTIDAIIEAGLFHTQPLDLQAHVRHEGMSWAITGLRGRIGHSHIKGSISVTSPGMRHRIEGDIEADPLDFADLSSADHIAQQAALKRAGKQRLLPDTKVDLSKLARTDGTIRLNARSMAGAGTPPIRSVRATIKLDRSRLTVSPIRVGLDRGFVSGSLVSDQRNRNIPMVSAHFRLEDSDLSAFVEGGAVSGILSGELALRGPGRTLAQAASHADGRIRFKAHQGMLPARLAAVLGLDIGRAMTRPKGKISGLRCGALDLSVHTGKATIHRFVVDTTSSQAQGSGAIDLADETVHILMSGTPKKPSLIQLRGPAVIDGTLARPHVTLPKKDRPVAAIVGSIGRAVAGKQPVSEDIDCSALH
jgi:uncharacterized protein involved in outer membrane biogenesis